MNKHYDNLQTGDLVFFYGGGWVSSFITWATGGSYSHIAMILKDPIYIDIKLEGLYIIEANYPTEKFSLTSKNKYEHPLLPPEITSKTISNGVQIVPFEDVFKRGQHVYYRKLNCTRDDQFRKKIKELHDKVHHEPYDLDIKDWLSAEINIIIKSITGGDVKPGDFDYSNPFINKDRTDKFWCSALTGYFYVKLGFLDDKLKWTLLTPENFSNGKEQLDFINCSLDDDQILKK